METIQGYVDHIIYRNTENGYTVLVLVCEEEELTCVGVFSDIVEGENTITITVTSEDGSIKTTKEGDKYYLEPEFEEMVKRSGVSHIMVVSGMHMAIICGAFLKLLKFLKLENKISAVITAVFVFLFMAAKLFAYR